MFAYANFGLSWKIVFQICDTCGICDKQNITCSFGYSPYYQPSTIIRQRAKVIEMIMGLAITKNLCY